MFFGIDRVVQNTVGAEVYGRFFILLNIAIIFQIFLDLGIENFIRKEVAQYPTRSGSYLSNIIALKILMFIPYLIVCASIAMHKGISVDNYLLLFLILLNQFLASFILYIRANLGGLQLFKTESFISVLDRTLMILIVGFLLLYPVTRYLFRINWFVFAQTISYTFTLMLGLFILVKKTGTVKLHIQFKQIIPVIQKLKPYALLLFLMAVYYRADSIILSLLLPNGDEQAGIFAHAFRILDFMSNYAFLFPILLLPIFSKTLHQKQKIDGLLQLAVLLLIIPSLTVIGPAILYRRELFGLLYKEHINLSADVFAILTISYLGMCVSFTFGALLTANGNLKQLNLMAGTAVVINLILNLILIPRYQVMGAAIANASTQLFTLIVHIKLAWSIFKLKFNAIILIKFSVFILFMLFGGYLIKLINIHWLLGASILFSSGLLAAIIIGLISINGIRSILQERIQ
ncbi:hypothetical protein ES705_32333 [subsurface metagenome]